MKLYVARATCSLAVQLVANELGLSPELVHYDVHGKGTSNGESFADVNQLSYVPASRWTTMHRTGSPRPSSSSRISPISTRRPR
jgi:hypothetical protein